MKKYNRYNFFKHTFCNWEEVDASVVANREGNYKSSSGSVYYFDEVGVVRFSNHWGRAANCRWRLQTKANKQQGYHYGYARWVDFFPTNDTDKLYAIVIDEKTQDVTFQHKACLKDMNTVLRNALETAKRIQKIKQIIESDSWYKYMDHLEIEEARLFLVQKLQCSNNDFQKIRRELLSSSAK